MVFAVQREGGMGVGKPLHSKNVLAFFNRKRRFNSMQANQTLDHNHMKHAYVAVLSPVSAPQFEKLGSTHTHAYNFGSYGSRQLPKGPFLVYLQIFLLSTSFIYIETILVPDTVRVQATSTMLLSNVPT